MSIGDRNSIAARTRYRLRFFSGRLKHRLIPTSAPSFPVTETPLPDLVPTVSDPRVFVPTDYGSGAFGHWILDEAGLPAYQYEMNQYEDDRATYPVSRGGFRRDHWHQLGNHRITALASNDGTVQVYIADRGGMWLNHFNQGELISWLGGVWELIKVLAIIPTRLLRGLFLPQRNEVTIIASLLAALNLPRPIVRLLKALHLPQAQRLDDQHDAYAGGFGYVYDGVRKWSTAYLYHPALRGNTQRVFGMGYAMTSAQNGPIHVVRRVYAPAGDVSALLVDVTLTNTGADEVNLSYYEYWDVNVEQLVFQPFRSGLLGSIGDSNRRALNRKFAPSIRWDETANTLRFHLHPPETSPSPSIPDAVDWLPQDVFLADLSGRPDGKYVNKRRFFGEGGAEQPDAIGTRDDEAIEDIPDSLMPYCMVLRRALRLQKGETTQLRFAYGTIEPDFTIEGSVTDPNKVMPAPMSQGWKTHFQQKFHLDNTGFAPFDDMLESWKRQLAYFTIGSQPHLQREMAWHAYYLQSSIVTSQYFRARVVPQGSAYLYLHGFDGVPRDHALFTLPLIYLDPKLARDMLCLIMQMASGIGGQIAYSYKGNGALSDALVHKTPSDLDLFFLLALTEYIAATGDVNFLEEEVPFYPGRNQPDDRTVLNHVRVAFDHLTGAVGIGKSNLIRVLDGDWSDDVVLKNVFPVGIGSSLLSLLTSPRQTVEEGESVLNSQMALYILPRITNLLTSQPSPLAQQLGQTMQAELDNLLPKLRSGIKARWGKKSFYARAILRYWWGGERVLHANQLDLEAQVWAFISDFEPEKLESLKNAVFAESDEPSPIGAVLASQQVWPAISQLLTWGYTHRYPELAWRSFVNHTFARKAEVYGNRWINIWTGPDGVNGPHTSDPGGTYETWPVTPMTDFPAMNNNQHAMALLALLRVCGIEPTESGDGLRITPKIPQLYTLDVPLLRLEITWERIRGIYRAYNAGTRRLYVRVLAHHKRVQVTVNNHIEIAQPDDEGYVRITLPEFQAHDQVSFEIVPLMEQP